MKSLVNYALAYAAKGFYVLPMAVRDKRPLIEFADRPAIDASRIGRVWKRHPNAQIAFRTVDFFVIDIDNHANGANGLASFNDYKNKHPDQFPATLSQTTHSGGKQFFYKKPLGLDMTQAIGWLPGVDVKAHPNNYVVVAPSSGVKGTYKWDNKLPIAQAPETLIKAIISPNHSRATSYHSEGYKGLTGEQLRLGQHSKTAELFEQIVNGLGSTGGRNMALAAFVGGLLFRNVDAKVVYELAIQANQHTQPALDAKEFDRTFDSMVKKEMRRRNNA